MPGSSRRQPPGARIRAAVGLLAVATALTAGSIALARPALIAVAAVLTVVAAWGALRLAWNAVVTARYENAVDRAELARVYRSLFAERAVEHAEFVTTVTSRAAARAEATEQRLRAQLEEQLGRIEGIVGVQRPPQAQRPPLRRVGTGARPPGPDDRRAELTALEPDLVESLMAWEKHAERKAAERRARARPGATG